MENEFKKIWEKIYNLDKRITSIEDIISNKKDVITKEFTDKYERLVIETGIEKEKIQGIVYIEEDGYKIISEIEGKNNKEKQIIGTLVILTIQDICYGNNNIKSQELKNRLEYLGIGSLVNLSTNLKTIRNFIIPDGKEKSPDYGYKLTLPGRKEGIDLLKKNFIEKK